MKAEAAVPGADPIPEVDRTPGTLPAAAAGKDGAARASASPPGPVSALGRALRKVSRAAPYLLGAYALNLALAAILGAIVFDAVQTSLGSSLAGARMRAGWDQRWYEAFAVQTQGVASTFRPSISGPGGVLDALDSFGDGFASLRGRGLGNGVLGLMAGYMIAWAFLSAALLGTFAERPAGAGFLARGGRWFPRLLPITIGGLVFYALVLGPLRLWLDATLEDALHEVIDERVRLAWLVVEYAGLWLLVAFGNLVLDYAKIFRVLAADDGARLPSVRALGTAGRLLARRPFAIIGLYALTALCGLAAVLAYVAVAPGAAGGGSWPAIAAVLLLGQLFVLSRIVLRALFLAGEVVMAGGSLAAFRRAESALSPPSHGTEVEQRAIEPAAIAAAG